MLTGMQCARRTRGHSGHEHGHAYEDEHADEKVYEDARAMPPCSCSCSVYGGIALRVEPMLVE